ncbi:hypothetical protein H9Q10_04060 [Eikenella sp. S3360]|uniref:Uncharacterized protein n=1 Tax=Eikenella glucosivorans TaxID=2766967 RepID=A0ABS0N984_9NEIS|nr:hypothetical protein [Eikenella glucosivorans]MBH5328840.1 hypothetical protein [Eikenella glucosivorans]
MGYLKKGYLKKANIFILHRGNRCLRFAKPSIFQVAYYIPDCHPSRMRRRIAYAIAAIYRARAAAAARMVILLGRLYNPASFTAQARPP